MQIIFSSYRRWLYESVAFIALSKVFLVQIWHKHADIWFERACTFIHAWWFRQSQYKLKSSRETGTCVTKSSWPRPDPADKPLSCEINTFRQSWDYIFNTLITISTMEFVAVLTQSHIKLDSSRLFLHFLLCNVMSLLRKTSKTCWFTIPKLKGNESEGNEKEENIYNLT